MEGIGKLRKQIRKVKGDVFYVNRGREHDLFVQNVP